MFTSKGTYSQLNVHFGRKWRYSRDKALSSTPNIFFPIILWYILKPVYVWTFLNYKLYTCFDLNWNNIINQCNYFPPFALIMRYIELLKNKILSATKWRMVKSSSIWSRNRLPSYKNRVWKTYELDIHIFFLFLKFL